MPPTCRRRGRSRTPSAWRIGKPDLIVKTKDVVVKANAPDWWGEIESVPIGLDEDRYVAAIEIKEVNDVPKDGNGRHTVGGRFVFHHMIWSTRVLDRISERDVTRCGRRGQHRLAGSRGRPQRRLLRSASAARLLRAGSHVVSNSVHLHSNGRDTKAHLEIGFKLHPKGYKPMYRRASVGLGNGVDIDIKPMEANQQLHAYAVLQEHTKIMTFEPHLHAPGMRMCLEAIWGYQHPDADLRGLRPQLGAGLRVRRRPRAAAAEGDDPAHHRLHGQFAGEQEHPGSAELAGVGQPVGGQHVHRPRDAAWR